MKNYNAKIVIAPMLLVTVERDNIVSGGHRERNVYYSVSITLRWWRKKKGIGKKCTRLINSLRAQRSGQRGVPLSPNESKT